MLQMRATNLIMLLFFIHLFGFTFRNLCMMSLRVLTLLTTTIMTFVEYWCSFFFSSGYKKLKFFLGQVLSLGQVTG